MKARNVSRAFLTQQTADTCGVSTDSFKDGVTVTRVLRRLLRCLTGDPARGKEKALFLGLVRFQNWAESCDFLVLTLSLAGFC